MAPLKAHRTRALSCTAFQSQAAMYPSRSMSVRAFGALRVRIAPAAKFSIGYAWVVPRPFSDRRRSNQESGFCDVCQHPLNSSSQIRVG
eukprot:3753667-Amphidinium_carterae.1